MTEWITASDGVRIAYHEVGAGDPAIILIHGAYGKREDSASKRSTSLPITAASRSISEATATATSRMSLTPWNNTATTWEISSANWG